MTTAMQLIPFTDAAQLPAHLQAFASTENEFGFSSNLTTISLKGKVFTINRGGEKTLVTKPDGEGEPANSIEVVILKSAPKGGHFAKAYYVDGYVEGSDAKPVCSSIDGIVPEAGAESPQATKCALCPQNVAGSGATAQNPQGKACRSSKVLAVAPAGQINDVMMLRVPGASTLRLSEYGEFLAKRGVQSSAVVTKISMDYSVAYPALTFKAVGFVTPAMAAEIATVRESDAVKFIIGEKVAPKAPESTEQFETPKPEAAPAAPKAAAKPAAPKAAAKTAPKANPLAASDDDLPTTPRANVAVEGETAAAPKAEPVVEVTDGGIDDALAGLDFDD